MNVSDKFECELMNWKLFDQLAEIVAEKIIKSGYNPNLVVGIARGGWVLSRILCDYLGVRDLLSLKVEHWGITATPDGKAQLKYPFKIDLNGRRVLVVDDITDTGESMTVAIEYLKTLNPGEIRSAALRHIKGSKFIPDYFGDEITWRWVIFPWNYTEDMCNILPNVLEKNRDIERMQRILLKDYNIKLGKKDIRKILKELKRREAS